MGIIQKYKNWKDAENRAPINLRNIWAVIQASFRKNISEPAHIKEQTIYRLSLTNEECKKAGTCIKCGCSVEEKIWEDRSCEGKCYPPMMSKKYWKEYKEFLND